MKVMEIRFKDLIHIVDLFLVWLLSGCGTENKSGFVLFIQSNLADVSVYEDKLINEDAISFYILLYKKEITKQMPKYTWLTMCFGLLLNK